MELIQMPRPMQLRGFTGWPEIYQVSAAEPLPPRGVSYLIAEKTDEALLFRLMIPILMKQHPYFNWMAVYESLVGEIYTPQRIYPNYGPDEISDEKGYSYYESGGDCDMTLEELAADTMSYVDLDMLTQLQMIPAFMADIRDAVKVNVTNHYAWTDGFNKKTGLCSGYLTEQPEPRSLIILDISSSIPDGVSAGMMTLLKTMSEITHSDVILTGSRSYFYTIDEVRNMDIDAERKRIGRSNESSMFRTILQTHDMDYDTVITFGDSDNPGPIQLKQRITTQRWYSFFVGQWHDWYGRTGTKYGSGYGQWIEDNNPRVNIIRNNNWAKFFTNGNEQW